jgi:trans-2,3-dihydro-3-hydroxyanthranilate isomerase
MRALAREFNQSETTFLLPPRCEAATWRLRSFTPSGAEVVGAGHNALGAWWWLADAGRLPLNAEGGRFAQELGERVLSVEIVAKSGRPTEVWMEQEPVRFGNVVADRAELAAGLGLAESHLNGSAPAQVASTGVPHLLVPARDRAAVDRARPNAARLAAVLDAAGAQGCYLYSLVPIDVDAIAYARASSTPASASMKTQRPAARLDRSYVVSPPTAWSRGSRLSLSSKGMR